MEICFQRQNISTSQIWSSANLEIFQNSTSTQERSVYNFQLRVEIWRFLKTPLQRQNDLFLISTIECKFGDFSKLHFNGRAICLSFFVWRGDLEIFKNSTSTPERFVYTFCCQVQIWRFFKTPLQWKNYIFVYNF
jgi:hypothetical protein